jgi:hypothetical protein
VDVPSYRVDEVQDMKLMEVEEMDTYRVQKGERIEEESGVPLGARDMGWVPNSRLSSSATSQYIDDARARASSESAGDRYGYDFGPDYGFEAYRHREAVESARAARARRDEMAGYRQETARLRWRTTYDSVLCLYRPIALLVAREVFGELFACCRCLDCESAACVPRVARRIRN